jgi:nucleotide-binding universal stress UspA family protein
LDAAVLGETQLKQQRAASHAYLAQLAESLSMRWQVIVTTTVLEGRAVDRLYDHAIAAHADLVVMTTHGHGACARAWMGSVADALVRRLPMPIVLIRPHGEALDLLDKAHAPAFQHMLLPLDGSALAEEILGPAVALGRLVGARYTLLQALDPLLVEHTHPPYAAGLEPGMVEELRERAHAYLAGVAARLRAQSFEVQTELVVAQPHVAILEYAREHAVDLIAMSTHGWGGLARMLLGSVADKVVREASAPVLIQRPRAEAAPSAAMAARSEASHTEKA